MFFTSLRCVEHSKRSFRVSFPLQNKSKEVNYWWDIKITDLLEDGEWLKNDYGSNVKLYFNQFIYQNLNENNFFASYF